MKIKLALIFFYSVVSLMTSAQNIFVCSAGGGIIPYNAKSIGDIAFTANGSNLAISDNTYSAATIDSITLAAPSTMKYVGGDISRLTQFEDANAVYKDSLGNTVKPLTFFRQQGWNAIRIRLFVNPTAINEGVCQTLDYVAKLGKRIKDAGYMFMLDFHYSDYWADPGKQTIPVAWQVNKSASVLGDSLYNYTKHCLQYLTENGATPDFIQTGNEITYGMLWDVGKVQPYSASNWDVFTSMLKKAISACREVCPKAKVIIHTERSGVSEATINYYTLLKQYNVDYDIIGLSYYPFYHGFFPALNTTLTDVESSFPDKKIMIVEFGYYHAYYKGDYNYTTTYPATNAGQKAITKDMITLLLKHKNVNGLFWWYPEENSALNNWLNYGLFDCYNSNKALPAFYEMKNFR